MVFRLCYAVSFILIFFLSSYSHAQTNVVPLSNGQTGRLVAVTGINQSARTATVVIDARDRFGNSTRVVRTARFNLAKLKNYAKGCLRGPSGCIASVGIGVAIGALGWIFIDDQFYKPISDSSGGITTCEGSERQLENSEGVIVGAFGPIPCKQVRFNGAVTVIVENLDPTLLQWALSNNGNLLDENPRPVWYWPGPKYGPLYKYQSGADSPEPQINEEVSDAQVADVLLSNPTHLQPEVGVYPDVFDPVDLPEDVSPTDITDPTTNPDGNENTGEEHQDLDFEILDISSETIDVTTYFDWGDGWLPRTCPPSREFFKLRGNSIQVDFSILCGGIETFYPVLMISYMLGFLYIIIEGLR